MSRIRPPAVAGSFYPAQAVPLQAQVDMLLAAVEPRPSARSNRPIKALIVPHAGYVYSGPIAASAYALLRDRVNPIERVVMLGPAHRVPLRGLALPGCDAFASPLGEIQIDFEGVERVRGLPQVIESAAAHAFEHALEVQLPFLQTVLSAFRLLPLVVGEASTDDVAEVLERVWGGTETLIVISSDLSHYLPYASACARDSASIAQVLRLDPGLDHQQACGATPVNGLLCAARHHGLMPGLLDLRNSGDTAGDRSRVVGYAALSFSAQHLDQATDDATDLARLGRLALAHARAAIAEALRLPTATIADHPRLAQPAATFVTLRQRGELRGCVGSLRALRSLRDDLHHNARAAAFEDRRFAPLERAEFATTDVEVSLLSALEPLVFRDEAHALELIRPGHDGLVLQCETQRATLLPQVWAQLPDPVDFLQALKQKAGLPAQFWSPELRLSRYTVRKWREEELS